MKRVCSLDEAFRNLGVCEEDRLYDFYGSYSLLESWMKSNNYILIKNFVYKDE